MTIRIQIINGNIADKLRQRIRRKIRKLNTFYEKIIAAEVFLKNEAKDKEAGHQCEIRLVIKGYDLFGKSSSSSYEQAAAEAVESLRKKLIKKKTIRLVKRRKPVEVHTI